MVQTLWCRRCFGQFRIPVYGNDRLPPQVLIASVRKRISDITRIIAPVNATLHTSCASKACGRNFNAVLTGITPRSSEVIDYSNFGKLGEIIKTNWDIFGDMFRDVRAVQRVLSSLNTLRAPMAHCKALAEDEVLRLDLTPMA